MMEISGKPMLQHVIERCQKIKRADAVVCTFPAEAASKPLYSLAAHMGITAFYGPENNVLGRYHNAASAMGAEVIVRITADCPLIDPEICDKVIALRASEFADYASNCWPRSFPKGLDCEVFTFNALRRAYLNAVDPYDIEHVTPYIIKNMSERVNLASGKFNVSDLNWSVDTLEDLERVRAIFAAMEKAA
jgi:spore coat polysaccharide biosynthesis protein SpsF